MEPRALASAHLRIARPTDRLEEVVEFYVSALGFELLGEFKDHAGFDGAMLGHREAAHHLEFTHARGHSVGDAPSKDHLMVFYLPDREVWQATVDHIESLGFNPVDSFNPYWDERGRTYEDPDGYRVVMQCDRWPR
ncbi:MAG: VOC family protein [Planctomycetota bacterium]